MPFTHLFIRDSLRFSHILGRGIQVFAVMEHKVQAGKSVSFIKYRNIVENMYGKD